MRSSAQLAPDDAILSYYDIRRMCAVSASTVQYVDWG